MKYIKKESVSKKNKSGRGDVKWKFVLTLVGILCMLAGSLIGMVAYYHFDWGTLADITFYENLADPSMRIVKIQEGLRKEQVADVVGNKLGWDTEQKKQFEVATLALAQVISSPTGSGTQATSDIPENMEGYYFPKTYMLSVYDEPATVQKIMVDTFQTQTSKIKKTKSTQIIGEQTALTIASIIQREAAGKQDMNLISGIIWNRIFKGMKLQMDATLQYAKGNITDGWWPPVASADKYIESPYNTYKYAFPPAPIASPGLAAITAAYNPQKTSCLFYLHDKNRKIHCSVTYAEHLRNIARYY